MLPTLTIAEVNAPGSPFMLQNRKFSESLEIAAKYGFKGVELQLRSPEDFEEDILLHCEKYGLKIVSIATGLACKEGLSLSSSDSNIRKAAVSRIKEQIKFSASIKDRPAIMIGLLVGSREETQTLDQYYDNLGSSLKELADFAESEGIGINLEPINHLDNNILNTWTETVDFLKKYDCTYIKLGADLYHMRLGERDIVKTLHRYWNRIGCVQLMDDNRRAPGLGNFEFSKIVRAIKDEGYDGPIIMECLPEEDVTSALILSMDFYRKYFD